MTNENVNQASSGEKKAIATLPCTINDDFCTLISIEIWTKTFRVNSENIIDINEEICETMNDKTEEYL